MRAATVGVGRRMLSTVSVWACDTRVCQTEWTSVLTGSGSGVSAGSRTWPVSAIRAGSSGAPLDNIMGSGHRPGLALHQRVHGSSPLPQFIGRMGGLHWRRGWHNRPPLGWDIGQVRIPPSAQSSGSRPRASGAPHPPGVVPPVRLGRRRRWLVLMADAAETTNDGRTNDETTRARRDARNASTAADERTMWRGRAKTVAATVLDAPRDATRAATTHDEPDSPHRDRTWSQHRTNAEQDSTPLALVSLPASLAD